jgi:hypothetical protein
MFMINLLEVSVISFDLNINKENNHISPQLIEHKKYHHIFRASLGEAQTCGGVKPINQIQTVPS